MTAPCPSLGFRVVIEAATGPDGRGLGELLDAWSAFLAGRGLCTAGAGRSRMNLTVRSEASQATENDRVATREWLASRPELKAWQVGDLEDLDRDDP